MGKNWNDIGYNFIIGGDGRIYEGRGQHRGAHSPVQRYDLNLLYLSITKLIKNLKSFNKDNH